MGLHLFLQLLQPVLGQLGGHQHAAQGPGGGAGQPDERHNDCFQTLSPLHVIHIDPMGEVNWPLTVSAAALAGLLSLLTSVAGLPEGVPSMAMTLPPAALSTIPVCPNR